MATESQTAHLREISKKGAQARKVAAVERRIKELVDAAPPLSDEVRDRLALLLRGSAA